MYRSVLALLFTSVLLLSGCAVGQQTVPKEKSGRETRMDRAAFDRSDEEITYMDTTEKPTRSCPTPCGPWRVSSPTRASPAPR